MTEIKYENGVVVVSQYGVTTIRFRPCDLDYDSRTAMYQGVTDVAGPRETGMVGFLKTQPVEARQEALEEVMGVSFPCGTGGVMEPEERCGRCGYIFDTGDLIHEAYVAGEYTLLCKDCNRSRARRG